MLFRSPITLNATLTGLKFFFDITLGRLELMARMQPVKLPRRPCKIRKLLFHNDFRVISYGHFSRESIQ